MDRKTFSPEEAAKIIGVGRTLIFEEIRGGRLEAKKAGRRTLITAEALDNWLSNLPPSRIFAPTEGTWR
jgi:excisionase family DNA binding protein